MTLTRERVETLLSKRYHDEALNVVLEGPGLGKGELMLRRGDAEINVHMEEALALADIITQRWLPSGDGPEDYETMRRITLRLEDEEARAIDEARNQYVPRLTRSTLVRRALHAFLARHEIKEALVR